MNRYTQYIVFLMVLMMMFASVDLTSGKKPGIRKTITNPTLVNLDTLDSNTFLLFWEQQDKKGSRIHYQQLTGGKIHKSRQLVSGHESYCDASYDFEPDYGLATAFLNGIDINVWKQKIEPPIAEIKLKIKAVRPGDPFLMPGDTTVFDRSVRITDGSVRVFTPDVTVDKHGLHIVWVAENSGNPSTADIMYRYVGEDTSSDCIRVSTKDGLLDHDPVITHDPLSNEIYIFWTAESPGTGYDIYYTHGTYKAGFKPELPIVETVFEDTNPVVTAGDDGIIYLAYETGDPLNRDVAGLYLEPGIGIPVSIPIHLPNLSNDRRPSLDVDPISGNPVVAWENDELGSICVMAKDFCSPGSVCWVTNSGPWKDLQPSIAASLLDDTPTVSWSRYYDDEDVELHMRGPWIDDDEGIE